MLFLFALGFDWPKTRRNVGFPLLPITVSVVLLEDILPLLNFGLSASYLIAQQGKQQFHIRSREFY